MRAIFKNSSSFIIKAATKKGSIKKIIMRGIDLIKFNCSPQKEGLSLGSGIKISNKRDREKYYAGKYTYSPKSF